MIKISMFFIMLSSFLLFSTFANDINSKIINSKVVHHISSTLKTEEYFLPNGLSVFLTVNKFAPNTVVSHWVKAGSLHEKKGITGIAHLFEHMMFRPLSPNGPTFYDIAGKLGADFNANTRFESTYYYTSVANKNLIQLLKAESNRFKNLQVSNDMLNAERKAVWSEYSTKFDANPTIDLWFQIYQSAFVGHPFGWMIIGFREDLEKITANDCNEFFKKYYTPNNTGLFVTGNFDSNKVLREIIKLYGDWKQGEVSTLPAPYAEKTSEIVAEGKLPSSANMVLFGFRTPYFDQKNSLLQTLVNLILFDSKNGLVKKRLVDANKLATEVNEFNFGYDNGMLKAGITLLPTASLNEVRAQMNLVKSDFLKMSAEEFNVFKRHLLISESEGLQRNASLGEFLAKSWGKYGDISITSMIFSRELHIDKNEVQDFLNQYFVNDNFVYLTHKQNK